MATLLKSHRKDLGGFSVSRIIPNARAKSVGPFVFVDHMGPAEFVAGTGINVRPHPHIGLATISYLLQGSMLHRDSLGTIQEIHPGDVNWMTAGKGIVHSERETLETRGQDHTLNGLQCWIALPEDKADMEPGFIHVNKAHLPYIHCEKVLMRLIAGEAFGYSSPVKTYTPMFYLDIITEQGAVVARPCHESQTACYVMSGAVTIGQNTYRGGDFVILDDEADITTQENSRYFLLGGKPLAREPILKWNFLAYSADKIAQAEQRWKNGQFPTIPGDDHEFIPLP
ncbi:pirin family protein [Salinimonas lutimaris]|uniref:pirin family protein n=1 Tax=Salinimonas lutimaris TaxID=914153 RepID=UPI0010C0F8DC|nr:pirin family protein [Salinimonas lutimaris]